MFEYLYSTFPVVDWHGLSFILLFMIGTGIYQWGVATGETRSEQKREQEQQQRVNRYRY